MQTNEKSQHTVNLLKFTYAVDKLHYFSVIKEILKVIVTLDSLYDAVFFCVVQL